jgi:16S rRNA (guanine966-N2)-methyltransferase
MSLRIIGGLFKSRTLKSPSGPLTKPTTSLIRKAVFDICQAKINDAFFLDLFACSGAMGLEAISRGAKHATFIEKDKKTAKTLFENIETLQVKDQTKVLLGDVFTLIKSALFQKNTYDIIYIDPPYPLIKDAKKPIEALLHTLDNSSLLTPSTSIFMEEGTPSSFCFEKLPFSKLKHKSTRRFGDSFLHELTIPFTENS